LDSIENLDNDMVDNLQGKIFFIKKNFFFNFNLMIYYTNLFYYLIIK